MMNKCGAKKGKELEKLLFQLNAMSRDSGAGAPVDHFLGRNVKTLLPNAGNKVLSFRRELERRKQEQGRWMRRLGRGGSEAYEMGDAVRVQDTQSGQWSLKGVISDVIEHDDSTSKTYQVTADNGGVRG